MLGARIASPICKRGIAAAVPLVSFAIGGEKTSEQETSKRDQGVASLLNTQSRKANVSTTDTLALPSPEATPFMQIENEAFSTTSDLDDLD